MRRPLFANLLELLVVIFVSAGTISALSANAPCYSPNGELAPGNYPCFLGQAVSPCCGAGSICEASGLCKVPGSVGVSDLIRGQCTDASWASAACPQYCTDADTGGTNLISCQNVTNSDLDFCCDHTNGCCDSGIGRFRISQNTDVLTLGSAGAAISTSEPTSTSSIVLTISTSSSSSTTTPSSTSTSSSSTIQTGLSSTSSSTSSSASSPTHNTASSGLSTGAKAGIGIGCAVVSLAVIGGRAYVLIRRKRSTVDYPVEPPQVPTPQEMAAKNESTRPVEIMTTRQDIVELS